MTNPYICKCPYCGNDCEADWVDVGVPGAMVQCGPFYCEWCRASEIGPFDPARNLTLAEKNTGWYRPNSPLSSIVNQVDGIPIDHQTAKTLYELGINIKG